ncbi:phytoene desaturase family protein [Gephyromycinifex aptenodytis]|uniref:phytoene desaturase family protein n=1 Tax=Gephyromycinifex aptenodytis TaxID=2716227 RepID=UPI001B2FF823|nr:NAD(P)/FAD-dependent oxidoreductase [Gephyromycinifex aptenodytis]
MALRNILRSPARPPLASVPTQTVDAVVVGGGHHGLVTAAVLADAGWDVLLFEGQDEVGGAVGSRDVDGWIMDTHSACHPLAVASPVLRALELGDHGLEWASAERVLAHVGQPGDERGAALFTDPELTAQRLAEDHPEDGQTWLRLVQDWQRLRDPLLEAILTQWPPVSASAKVLARVGAGALPDFVRFLLLPAHRMGEELFRGQAGRELIAGNAMHADIPLEAPVSGMFGWLMTMLAQDAGFPSPKGGTRELALALKRRAQAAGAQIHTGVAVQRITVQGNTVHGVVTSDGQRIRARRAVIADTSAPDLYGRLLPAKSVPAGLSARMERFLWDLPTLKLNYRLSAPMPWTAEAARGAGVVHVGQDVPGLVTWAAELGARKIPQRPFALVGQMSTIDPSRSPAGSEALWLYTHLPREQPSAENAARLTDASETMLDAFAPGWRDLVIDRWDQTPADLEAGDPNLGQGGVGGGTQQLFQQALWRPVTGLGGPRTHIEGLYLGSAAIHPGGGVHGGCGYLAARAALADQSWWGRPVKQLSLAALHHLYADDRRLPPGLGSPGR